MTCKNKFNKFASEKTKHDEDPGEMLHFTASQGNIQGLKYATGSYGQLSKIFEHKIGDISKKEL